MEEEQPGTSVESVPKSRKRVPRKKLVRKKKERGKYKQKASVGACDVDVTDCIFSDEELRAGYMDEHEPHIVSDGADAVHSLSEGSDIPSTSGLDSPCSSSAVSESATGSRPASAASIHSDTSSVSTVDVSCRSECSIDLPTDSPATPSSSTCSRPGSSTQSQHSRPGSSAQSHQSRPLSASSEIHLILGASEPSLIYQEVCKPSMEIITNVLATFKDILPSAWIAIAEEQSIHLFLLSLTSPKAIQREVKINFNGLVSVNVHCESLLSNKVLTLYEVPVLDDLNKVPLFCVCGMKIVKMIMKYDTCIGANHGNTSGFWALMPDSYIDRNPYKEQSYSETCRSKSCQWLVETEKGRAPRCASCTYVFKKLKKRETSVGRDAPSPFTPNVHLTLPQAINKMKLLHEEIRKKDKKLEYLKNKVSKLLTDDGVDIEEDVSTDLSAILKSSPLSEIQKLFLEQQLKASSATNPRCRRWHPTIIRLALHLKMTSSSSYEALRDSGAIMLPSSRTLFDYSHAIKSQMGVNDGILERVEAKIKEKPKEFQKFVSLLCDEMYVSRNLVYRERDNTLIGYQHLQEVERELAEFENYVDGQTTGTIKKYKAQVAKTMLAFMVKGVCTNIKYVVAAYPMNSVSAQNIYVRAWQVIGRLEKAGIKVLAFVCDSAAPNRTFVGMHTPLTNTGSSVVFDTRNFCSPEGRPLFFIFDESHILKTIRNCFHNSGDDDKKPRCMEFNGEKIMWKTIVRLYLDKRNCNFRKAYKLNAQNVFPNAFSCMKVKLAAEVLSNTVANDIESKQWPQTSETVRFIRYNNKCFDCLNTAYRDQAIRTRNSNLAPYTDVNDTRFSWLGVPNAGHENDHGTEMPFLEYLKTWKAQVDRMPIDAKEKEKKKLSWQVMHSIETTIRAFAGAVRFMLALSEPPQFILGRAFSQDPLEQHFSLQRAGFGGSRNPNVKQFLGRQVSLAVQQELGVKKRKGNVEAGQENLKITADALPKRPRNRRGTTL